MMALILPSMPGKLTAAFIAASAVGFIVAITKDDRNWMRAFIAGFAADAIRFAYSAATSGSNLSDQYHSVVQVIFASAAIVAFILSIRLATTQRQRVASLGMTLYLATGWWNSVLAAACGNVIFQDCRGFAAHQIPVSLEFLLYLAAPILLVVAARIRDEEPPSRLIGYGLAAFTFYAAYITSFGVFHHNPPDGLTTAASVVTRFGALAMFIFAARSVAKERIFALALAVFMIPFVWTALVRTFGGTA